MAHILVVDDDQIIRKFLAEILRQDGHTIIEAENGQMGLEKIKTNPVDLIITDIFMPEMDGIDLLVAIMRTYPGSKIIAISGGYKAMDPQVTLGMAQLFGAVDIMTKPLHASVVIHKVGQALHSQPTGEQNKGGVP
ncbi:MAG: response regulator [Magnetococcales bacterium]|nr:response regulator [Magnetococcales bacterium]